MVALRAHEGFTLAELLVAAAVAIIALGLCVNLLHPVTIAFRALPEAADSQQRLRIAVQALVDDIAGAGAGPAVGWGSRAVPAWPAVLPCRWAGGFVAARAGGCAEDGAITVMAMALSAPQGGVAADMDAPGSLIPVQPLTACPLTSAACRFHEGARVLVTDGTGAWDLVPVTAVAVDGLSLEHAGAPLSRSYRAGALVGETTTAAYSLRVDPATRVSQLRRSINGSADMPLVDHVVALRFEYFGRADPPALVNDGDPAARRTSYGPLPPPAGVDDVLDAWPPGENCLFFRNGAGVFPRQAPLAPGADGLAQLPLALFLDGPWCPDELSPNRYDADLLRIGLVRVIVRTQAQSPAVRGLDSRLFTQPGSARETSGLVPDLEARVDAALRNR